MSLIDPLPVRDFFTRYWERKPLVLRGRDPQRYHGLPTVADFELLAASLIPADGGWFSVVKTHARPPAASMLGPDNLLNLAEMFGAYREGYSLLLNQVQRRHRQTGRLCRAIEAALVENGVLLSKHIGANAYLSPPRSQGFAIHYDPHDVFVLQLAGRKCWRIYGRHVAFPTRPPTEPIAPKVAGRPRREFIAQPGDLLYIPRGVLHDANTTDVASLHLTLSMDLVTWRDLIADVLASDAQFGRALPPAFARHGLATASDRKKVRAMVRALATSRAVTPAMARVNHKLLDQLVPLPTGGLTTIDDAGAVNPDTWLTLADGVLAAVTVDRTTATLTVPGASFRSARRMARAFRLLARGQRFRPRDLPVATTIGEKLAFLRELFASGVLAFAPDDRTVHRRSRMAIRTKAS